MSNTYRNISMNQIIFNKLQKVSKATGISMSKIIEQALIKHLSLENHKELISFEQAIVSEFDLYEEGDTTAMEVPKCQK